MGALATDLPTRIPRGFTPPIKARGTAESHSRLPTPDEIEVRAYEIYLSNGCCGGHDREHWLRAEHELMEELRNVQEDYVTVGGPERPV